MKNKWKKYVALWKCYRNLFLGQTVNVQCDDKKYYLIILGTAKRTGQHTSCSSWTKFWTSTKKRRTLNGKNFKSTSLDSRQPSMYDSWKRYLWISTSYWTEFHRFLMSTYLSTGKTFCYIKTGKYILNEGRQISSQTRAPKYLEILKTVTIVNLFN